LTDVAPPRLTRRDFASGQEVRWCPGCGDYAILASVQKLMPDLGIPREDIVFVSGIGCAARFPYYMNTYGFHTIHGRAPAFATGMKVANPELSVWVAGGDGDFLSIGGNHLLHVLRRNIDLQLLLFNNRIYGLTKGQYSPTSRQGARTKSTPSGSIDAPVDPLQLALGAGATFIARTVDNDAKHLQATLERAARHRGTSFVEILQNCPVFNDGEWQEMEEPSLRAETTLQAEHGQPLVFGGPGNRRGIAVDGFTPQVVDLADDEDPVARGVLVHDESDPGIAHLLARLHRPELPEALGVLRAVERAPYEELLDVQVREATARKGPGDLHALLRSGDTWRVPA
jgi:2-oxoglutarate ferredoxin oxidoreductase subunit beta